MGESRIPGSSKPEGPSSRTLNNCCSSSAARSTPETLADKSFCREGAAPATGRSARSYQPIIQTRTATRKFGHAWAGARAAGGAAGPARLGNLGLGASGG